MTQSVRDNIERQRFELAVDGHTAFSDYRPSDGVVTMMHTEVPKQLAGRGLGSQLVRGALDIVRKRGLKVVPQCPFVKSYIDKHPDYADLVK